MYAKHTGRSAICGYAMYAAKHTRQSAICGYAMYAKHTGQTAICGYAMYAKHTGQTGCRGLWESRHGRMDIKRHSRCEVEALVTSMPNTSIFLLVEVRMSVTGLKPKNPLWHSGCQVLAGTGGLDCWFEPRWIEYSSHKGRHYAQARLNVNIIYKGNKLT